VLFLDDADLRIAQVPQGYEELLEWDLCHVSYLRIGKAELVIFGLVEEHKDAGLHGGEDESIGFVLVARQEGLNLCTTMLEKPSQVTVWVLLFVELLEPRGYHGQLPRHFACNWLLVGPVTIGQYFDL
jgi:hypothetical protein